MKTADGKKGVSPTAAVIYGVVSVILIAALTVGNFYAGKFERLISVYLDHPTQKIISAEAETITHFTSDFKNDASIEARLAEIGTQIEAEGMVLLKNNGALPLPAGAKITFLGQNSIDPVYGGGGAGSVDASKAVSLKSAVAASGFQTNGALWDFYEKGAGAEYRKTTPDVYGQGSYAVNEAPADKYTDDIKRSFTGYHDAAVVVIGRSGGESSDLAHQVQKNGYLYLQVDDDERALLRLARENFSSVIVLLNTENPLELGVLEDFNVDACLWIGALGQTGAYAVADALSGRVNPSGALVDTYAYDSLGAPAMVNFGDFSISNGGAWADNKYLVYGEGIYVGYRYYETRYEDVVLGNEPAANFDYARQVQYPFGFNLSYTDFTISNYSVKEAGERYEVSATVTNNGQYAGKKITQIYMQSPYTDYDRAKGIEKSAVELAGFGKTGEIRPGQSETIKVFVDKESMKVYDANGYGTYILDAGDYYFAYGENAHDALNNILSAKGKTAADGMDYNGNGSLAAKITVNRLDSAKYARSAETGGEITNRFQDADIRGYDSGFKYLSRSDWTGTWPNVYANGAWTAPAEVISGMGITPVNDPSIPKPITGAINGQYGKLTAAMLMDADYDSELWDVLIEQMSVEELDKLVRVGGYATMGVDSIQLPATVDKDGPAGISGTLVGGKSGMSYPPAIVLASTFNTRLAEDFGKAIGEDSLRLGVTGWYAPAANIHRTPYSGRNFEYYSEDGRLSGIMCAYEIKGAQDKGVLVFMKHFAVNDQEVNRIGGVMLLNEQSMRQIYLLPFEIAVRIGGARGLMTSMNRIGTRWTGSHCGLMTNTLREEWGFEGAAITDQASFSVFAYEDMRMGLEAGNDLWLNSNAELWKLSGADMTNTVVSNMQKAAKNIAFAISRSNAMNGLSANSKVVRIIPLWRKWLIALDVAAGAAIAAVGAALILKRRRRKAAITVSDN